MKGVPLPWLAALLGAPVEFFGGLLLLCLAWRAAMRRCSCWLSPSLLHSSHIAIGKYSDAAARQAQFTGFSKNVAIIGGFGALLAWARLLPLVRFLYFRNPRRAEC